MGRLGCRFPQVQPWDDWYSGWHLDCTLWKVLSQRHRAKPHLTHRNSKRINICCFKPLNLGWFVTKKSITNTCSICKMSIKTPFSLDWALRQCRQSTCCQPGWEMTEQLGAYPVELKRCTHCDPTTPSWVYNGKAMPIEARAGTLTGVVLLGEGMNRMFSITQWNIMQHRKQIRWSYLHQCGWPHKHYVDENTPDMYNIVPFT